MPKSRNISLGNAGENLVLARLLIRGHHAALASRNSAAFDIITRFNRRYSSLRVKAGSTRAIRWNAKADGSVFVDHSQGDDTDFVVIVLMPNADVNSPEFYIVPTDVVDSTLKQAHTRWLRSSRRDGEPHKDTSLRAIAFSKTGRLVASVFSGADWSGYRDAWHLLEDSPKTKLNEAPRQS